MPENDEPKNAAAPASPSDAVPKAGAVGVTPAVPEVKVAQAIPVPQPKAPEPKVAEPAAKMAEPAAPEFGAKAKAAVSPKPAPAIPAKEPAKPVPAVTAAPVAKVEPVKAKPAAKAATPKAKPAPKVAAPKASVKPAPAAKPAPPVAAKPAPVARVFPVEATVAKPAIKVAKDMEKVAPVAANPKAAAPKTAKKTVADQANAFAGLFTHFMLEDNTMDMTANFSGLQDAMTEAQAKAKAAFEKGTSALGEVSDFAKGNVEAVMESGKILAEGVQGLGSELVSEGRTAFEAITGDIKELAAAKSPTDFFKIQGDMMRKNFDTAVAYGSKNSETMLKLMSDVMAPISGRVSIAMEKARSASI